MTEEFDTKEIRENLSRDGDVVEFMREGQAVYELMNEEADYDSIDGLALQEVDEGPTEEVYPDAAGDETQTYRWEMEGQDDAFFVLDQSSESIDQDNAYRSRVIHGEEARYQLVQEKMEGDLNVNLWVEGEPMFTVENQSDFERIWSEIQGQESEIGDVSRLDSYSASSNYFQE